MLYRLRLAGIFRNRALLFRTIVFWLESTRGYLHLPVYYAGLLLRVQHDKRALHRGLRGAKNLWYLRDKRIYGRRRSFKFI